MTFFTSGFGRLFREGEEGTEEGTFVEKGVNVRERTRRGTPLSAP